jgi:hypothetical protein
VTQEEPLSALPYGKPDFENRLADADGTFGEFTMAARSALGGPKRMEPKSAVPESPEGADSPAQKLLGTGKTKSVHHKMQSTGSPQSFFFNKSPAQAGDGKKSLPRTQTDGLRAAKRQTNTSKNTRSRRPAKAKTSPEKAPKRRR